MSCVEPSAKETLAAREQITGVTCGQIVSVAHRPSFTSATTSWSGFLLEIHAARACRQDIWWGWHRTHVCVVTSGTLGIRVRSARRNGAFLAPAGTVLIFPSGFREARFSYDDSELICVELDPLRATRFFGRGSPADGALTPQFGLEDAHIGALLTSMAAEVAEGCPAGNLYGESLSLSLAAYLEGRFAANKVERKQGQRGFSELQVRQLTDYIRANISSNLDLLQLANVVDMSPRQLFRMFADTFASSPHRYVTKERVVRAKALLSAGISLAEIAQTLGFANQSHFGDVFRKVTGVSPGRFRQEHYGCFPPRRRHYASKR